MKADLEKGVLYLFYESPAERERMYNFLAHSIQASERGLPCILGILEFDVEAGSDKPVVGAYLEVIQDEDQLERTDESFQRPRDNPGDA